MFAIFDFEPDKCKTKPPLAMSKSKKAFFEKLGLVPDDEEHETLFSLMMVIPPN